MKFTIYILTGMMTSYIWFNTITLLTNKNSKKIYMVYNYKTNKNQTKSNSSLTYKFHGNSH